MHFWHPARGPLGPIRSTKAVKLHTLLDLRGSIPTSLHISDGTLQDVNILDQLIPEAGAFYIMDRGYLDFARLACLDQASAIVRKRLKLERSMHEMLQILSKYGLAAQAIAVRRRT